MIEIPKHWLVFGYELTEDEKVLASDMNIGIYDIPSNHKNTFELKRIW